MGGLPHIRLQVETVRRTHRDIQLLLKISVQIAEPHHHLTVGKPLPAFKKRLQILPSRPAERGIVGK